MASENGAKTGNRDLLVYTQPELYHHTLAPIPALCVDHELSHGDNPVK
jgi:hypothetical protein